MTLVLTPGQRHEAIVFEPLLESGAVKRRLKAFLPRKKT